MKKSAKRNVIVSSLLAIILCISIMVGGTYAWFTDTASANVNKIEAGTLNVSLYMKDNNGDFVPAEGKTLQFLVDGKIPSDETQIFWEPNCTYDLPQLKIQNDGNLALKYKVVINGINGNAKLNEAIVWTIGDAALGEDKMLKAGESAIFTVSGHMKKEAGNEYQGLTITGISITVYATQVSYEHDTTDNTYDEDATYDIKINSEAQGNLVVAQASAQSEITVTKETEITDGTVSVTYPVGVVLEQATKVDGEATDEQKATVEQKLEYKGNTTTTQGVTVSQGQAVANYELTLPVAQTNTKLIPIKIQYQKGLNGVEVYHSGNKVSTTVSTNAEYFIYNSEDGTLTLYLFHASKIDIVYNKAEKLPENTQIVKSLDELEAAVGALHDGDYIALGANIATNKNSGQITFTRAENTSGKITATLDLNDYVFAGQIGDVSFDNDDITVNVIGTEKAIADFYKHQEGHLVNTFAVLNYSGKTILKKGLFESNNITIGSYGGEIVIDGGYIHNSTAGLCVYAVNNGLVTVNGGNFSFDGEGGALFLIESTSTDPTIVINGGTFDASKGNAFVFQKTSTSCDKCSITINGGDFTFKSIDDIVGWVEGTSEEWAKKHLIIKGGNFNFDVSEYVDLENYEVVRMNGKYTVIEK